jgi:prepilin-type N-terminal cleavage/methylation domain-containing protein
MVFIMQTILKPGRLLQSIQRIHPITKPMKTNPRMRRGFTLIELLVVIVIIAALAGLTAPMVIKQRRKADQTEAVSNAKQIGLALFEFETAYGSFPDSTTAPTVTTNTGSTLTISGTTANDYFRQLIAAEVTDSEQMFYAKTAFSKKPDGVSNTTETALAAGEVGFGYLMKNDNTAFSSAGNSGRPIVVAPLAYPFIAGNFDSDMYDSKAVVLKIDNSVTSLQILKSSHLAQLGGGQNLLQTGDNTIWGSTVTPIIVNPISK